MGSRLPIENNDEPAHTFVDVPLVHSALASGVLLKIDLGQNFGAPLLGDPVVCPFAPHALTYALLRPARAMLFNKFILAALTTAALTAFFAGYFTLPIASLCAVLAFTSPSFLYFFQHHPHQGALLYVTLLLLALRRFLREPLRVRAAAVSIATLALCVGTGTHGVLLGGLFAAAFTCLSSDATWRTRLLGLAVMVLSVAALAPHFIEFMRHANASARMHVDYQSLFAKSPSDLMRDLLLISRLQTATGSTIHHSIAVLVLSATGMVFARGELMPRRLAVALGWIPLLAVVACKMFPGAASHLPLVKSMNITRVLWFADVFLLLGAGVALSALWRRPVVRRHVWLAGGALLLALLPQIAVAASQLNWFRATERDTGFQPAAFLPLMQPGMRLAADVNPLSGTFDIRAIPHGMLASSGHQILHHDRFRSALSAAGLIGGDWLGLTYMLGPAAPARLAPYGVRYFATTASASRLLELGWQRVAEGEGVTLFESPLKPTAVYIDGAPLEFLEDYTLRHNELRIGLPPGRTNYTVVATFVALPGWKAFIDDARTAIDVRADEMIAVRVSQGRSLRLVYEPWTDRAIAGVFALALLAAALAIVTLVPRDPAHFPRRQE